MGSYFRICEKKGCFQRQPTKTWWDDQYDKNNPFLCSDCIDEQIKDFNLKIKLVQPERPNEKTRKRSDGPSL